MTTPTELHDFAPKSVTFTARERRRLRRRDFLRRTLLPALARPMPLTNAPAFVIAPHQDDETLGCGGLIAAKRAAGIPVTVVFLTDGALSHGDLSGAAKAAHVARREGEALAALSALGVPAGDIQFWRYPDGSLSALASSDRAAALSRLTSLHNNSIVHPVELFLPHRRDSHPDHEAAFALAHEAVAGSPSVTLYEYPVWLLWSRNRLFDSLRWSDLSGCRRLRLDTAAQEAKARAMAEYVSQLENLPPGFAERLVTEDEFFFRSR